MDGDGQVTRRDAETIILGHTQTGTPWQNPTNRFDVNNDGFLAPSDFLALINWQNAFGYSVLPATRPAADPFLDVSGDNVFSQLDYDQLQDKYSGGDGLVENEHQNVSVPTDVNADGLVTPADIGAILDYLSIDHIDYQALALDQITIRAGNGNDHISAQLLGAQLLGGGFANLPAFYSFGGAGNDILKGSRDRDFLFGGPDNDTLTGNAGNDIVDGGDGIDTLTGGEGVDLLTGGDGTDTLNGGSGTDHIEGGEGADILNGNDGDDTVDGGNENDTISGGAGNDDLIGGDGDDPMNGNDGNDELVGDAGNDTLIGGEGNDILSGRAGDDTLEGGNGDDELYGGEGTNTLDGGSGSNTTSQSGDWQQAHVQWGFIGSDIHEGLSTTVKMMRLPTGGQGSVSITIELLGGAARIDTANQANAVPGDDFGGPTTITVSIPSGQTYSEEFSIPLLLDDDVEPDMEIYWMQITDVQGGKDPHGPNNWASMYILDGTIQTVDDPNPSDPDLETPKNTPLPVYILANDRLPGTPGTTFTIELGSPGHGTVSFNGTVATYTPAQDYVGEDSFTYTMRTSDDQEDTATVHVNVWTITLDGMTVEEQYWGDDPDTWHAAGLQIWSFDEHRWSTTVQPPERSGFVESIHWFAEPWVGQLEPLGYGTMFAESQGIAPAIGSPGPGDWLIFPVALFGLAQAEGPPERKTQFSVSVEWYGVDPGDGQTNLSFSGSAALLFPERNVPRNTTSPDGSGNLIDQIHDKIRLQVFVAPPVPADQGAATLQLKLFDPDNRLFGLFDPNDPDDQTFEPNDNRKPSGDPLGSWSIGIAPPQVEVQVSPGSNFGYSPILTVNEPQPGNNYVAATHHQISVLSRLFFAKMAAP